MAKKKDNQPKRRAVKLNEANGFPAVKKPTREDLDKLAAEAERDIQQRQDEYRGKHRRADGLPFRYAAQLRGVTAA